MPTQIPTVTREPTASPTLPRPTATATTPIEETRVPSATPFAVIETPRATVTPTLAPTRTPTATATVMPTPTPTPQPQARLVVALEESQEPMSAGESRLLTLVVRNDGDLPSDPMTLINVLPVYWRVLGVSASKGLVSIIPGEVRVVLGRIRAREQILVAVTVQAPDVRSADELCVSLRNGVLALPEICGPLPEVREPSPQLGAGTAQTEATADSSGPRPHLILLGNTIGEASPGQGGATLVIKNDGSESAHATYLYLELAGDWYLSDVVTTLGLVSVVDHAAVVRVGRLDPGALIAVTLRGRPVAGKVMDFCATLVTDGQARRRECSRLTTTFEGKRS